MDNSQFDEIRPYDDSEVPEVLRQLYADDEFIRAIARQRFGRLEPMLAFIAHPLIRRSLKPQIRLLKNVKIIQNKVKRYIKRMIRRKTDGFTVSGLDRLDRNKPMLLIGNHRDIALDAAFTNYALVLDDRDTCRLAIGDNLLSKPYVSHLMRLNKSFIVNRSATAPREMLANFKKLSAYIRHSLKEDKSNIWIAQSEGRAKDGLDKTHPAIIKMITMSKPKDVSFEVYIEQLNIVPISISYELDPNDGAKAKELYIKNKNGTYRKGKHEDVDSISKGISGEKGRIHLAFGTPLKAEFKNAKAVATEIDRQIISQYQLQPTNYFAYQMIHGSEADGIEELKAQFSDAKWQKRKSGFEERMQAIPEKHRAFALQIYANPVVQQLALQELVD